MSKKLPFTLGLANKKILNKFRIWPMTLLARRNILKFGLIFHIYTFYLNDHSFSDFKNSFF